MPVIVSNRTPARWPLEPVPDEADPQTIQDAQDEMGGLMAPDVIVTKTGPATALPGDQVDYTIEVKNEGFGPALQALMTDTNPDGTTQDIVLGALVVGDVNTQTGSFVVPADACPGDFTGASADVAFKDIVGHELTASGLSPEELDARFRCAKWPVVAPRLVCSDRSDVHDRPSSRTVE